MTLHVEQGARTYSVTQVQAFRECPAKWWYQWVLGHKPAPSGAMDAGVRAHEALATYYRTGALPDGPLAKACDPELRRGRLWVEQKFSMCGPGHTLIVGVIDLVCDTGGCWVVVDHKTTEKRQVEADAHKHRTQLGVYASVLFERMPEVEDVVVTIHAVSSTTGETERDWFVMSREECAQVRAEFDADILRMEAMRVPVRNFDSCRLWGACGVMGVCTADRLIKVGACAKSDT